MPTLRLSSFTLLSCLALALTIAVRLPALGHEKPSSDGDDTSSGLDIKKVVVDHDDEDIIVTVGTWKPWARRILHSGRSRHRF